MATHELKTWPEFFEAIEAGHKTFEVRKNDRGFQKGDVLHLREYCVTHENPAYAFKYTGNAFLVRVTYVLSGDTFGIKDGYVVMGIKKVRS